MDRVVTTVKAEPTTATITNRIGGRAVAARGDAWFEKRSPHDGTVLSRVARSSEPDVRDAVAAARTAFALWSATTPVKRGEILRAVCAAMRQRRTDLAQVVARETAKSPASALGEVDGAIALGEFYAGEGQRLFGRTMTSAPGWPGMPPRTISRLFSASIFTTARLRMVTCSLP